MKEKILVTGCSGFIGMHLCISLLKDGYEVLGLDDMNSYYDVSLKEKRLKKILKFESFSFFREDISRLSRLEKVFKEYKPSKIVNLAAQAGVRYSLENPHEYIKTNISGFMNILECCRHNKTKGLIYASSSSVYGRNKNMPFSVNDRVDLPISIYAASKRSNELMAYTYNHLYGLKSTGLRFFTVYGPWGRPDMAIYIFSEKIISKQKLPLFNNGQMFRDFTYIDDIILGIKSAININFDFRIFNLGNSKVEKLMDVISILEEQLGSNALLDNLKMQPGDVKKTYADIKCSKSELGFSPTTSISVGIPKFVKWFKNYKNIP